MTRIKHSSEEIEQAVKRRMAGDSVASLCKEFRISRAGLYLWLRKAKQEAKERIRARELGPKVIEQEARINMALYIKKLEQENEMIWGLYRKLIASGARDPHR